jgi:hypothetical protein
MQDIFRYGCLISLCIRGTSKRMFHGNAQARHILLAIALLAVLMRSLVPIGYMPDFGAHGGVIAIRICTGDSHEIIKVPADRYGKAQPAHSPHQNVPCDYAINHSFNPITVDIALLLLISFLSAELFVFTKLNISQRRYFGDMAARAPPICA